jgi:hypothetical protein
LDGDKWKGALLADNEDELIRKDGSLYRRHGRNGARLQTEEDKQKYENHGLKYFGNHRNLDLGIEGLRNYRISKFKNSQFAI